jgi:uncharacterized protein (DUF2147 family)
MMSLRPLILATFAALSTSWVYAADPLAGTTWRTFDDVTGKPKVLVQFQEKNGVLSGVITQRLAGSTITHCNLCKGKQKDHPLEGLQIISKLRADGKGSYQDGEILDPKTGKTYSLKGKLSKDGQKLELRGLLRFCHAGRDQTWTREK